MLSQYPDKPVLVLYQKGPLVTRQSACFREVFVEVISNVSLSFYITLSYDAVFGIIYRDLSIFSVMDCQLISLKLEAFYLLSTTNMFKCQIFIKLDTSNYANPPILMSVSSLLHGSSYCWHCCSRLLTLSY